MEIDETTRFTLEDLIGAGAIIGSLSAALSPEAQAAVSAFRGPNANLDQILRTSVFGKEGIVKGYADDVLYASELVTNDVAPVLHDRTYVNAGDL